jgi:nicotinamide riboside kinase
MGDHYLLCDIDLPWTSDGVRDRPHAREQLHAEFDAVLREFKAPRCRVRGAGPSRMKAALECIANDRWRM